MQKYFLSLHGVTNYTVSSVYNKGTKGKGELILTTTVYGDVLFVINFSMDLLSLFISGKILGLERKKGLLAISAALGGVYGVCALMIRSTALSIVLNVAIYIIMCLIAYPKTSRRAFIKVCFLFYVISLLCGGAVTSCYSLFDMIFDSVITNNNDTDTGHIPLWVFCIFAAVCAILSFVTGKLFADKKDMRYVTFSVTINGITHQMRALCDSGNLLKEPISGTPVIVASGEWFKNATGLCGDCLSYAPDMRLKLRYIPTSTATGEKLLTGILPDRIILTKEKTAVKAVIASAYDGEFSDFDGIAPLSIIP